MQCEQETQEEEPEECGEAPSGDLLQDWLKPSVAASQIDTSMVPSLGNATCDELGDVTSPCNGYPDKNAVFFKSLQCFSGLLKTT